MAPIRTSHSADHPFAAAAVAARGRDGLGHALAARAMIPTPWSARLASSRHNWRRLVIGAACIVLALAAAAFHLRGVLGFLHWREVVSQRPLLDVDYPFRLATILRAREFLRADGAFWGYDPFFLGGYRAGQYPIERLASLIAAVAPPSWVEPGVKLYVLFGFVSAPILLGLGSRAASGSSQAGLVGLLLGCWLWQTDAISFSLREVGSYGFVLASFAAPLVLAWLVNLVGRLRRNRCGSSPLLSGLSLCLLLYLHPLSLVILGPGLAVLAVAAVVSLPMGRLLVILGIGAGVTVGCLPWLVPALEVALAGGAPTPHGQTDPTDIARLLQGRAACLFVLFAAALGLRAWRPDGRWLTAVVLGSSSLGSLLLGVLGTQLGLGGLQPERFLLAAAAMAVPAAGHAVWSCLDRASLRLPLVVASIAIGSLYGLTRFAAVAPNWNLRYLTVDDVGASDALLAWACSTPRGSRLLIEDPFHPHPSALRGWLLALVPSRCGRELLGPPLLDDALPTGFLGLREGRLRGRALCDWTAAELEEFLDRYGVTHLAMRHGQACVPGDSSRLQPDRVLEPYSTFLVRQPTGRFLRGAGELTADYNRIAIRNATVGGVVLRYHYDSAWRAIPDLPVHRHEVANDPVGFIAVDNGAIGDFELVFRPSLRWWRRTEGR